ncbi:uncharacterized protein CEXT_790651 [Caerostris extrusa]|uniref:Uncharacterized protein n=1 Tax=Caerostris extrusa TaxID=172846 RepID=A0AAV4NT43_CAEEX|nr:uncharacterized protein CEXT_790651 [Caerostris extrusa]
MLAEQLIVNLSTTDSPNFLAEKLSPSSSYLLVSYASNPKGRSMSVALTGHTQLSKEQRTKIGETIVTTDTFNEALVTRGWFTKPA